MCLKEVTKQFTLSQNANNRESLGKQFYLGSGPLIGTHTGFVHRSALSLISLTDQEQMYTPGTTATI